MGDEAEPGRAALLRASDRQRRSALLGVSSTRLGLALEAAARDLQPTLWTV